MLEIVDDMWKAGVNYDAVCITTNGAIRKSDGCAVMGRGCAKEAATHWSDIPRILGDLIQENGNVVQLLKVVMMPPGRCATFARDVQLVSFPVKPAEMAMTPSFANTLLVAYMREAFRFKRRVPGWACVAQLGLIRDSVVQLIAMANKSSWKKILLPRPGCGAGELQWTDVGPILRPILDDRFTVISRKL